MGAVDERVIWAEINRDVPWRDRCGEPSDAFPIRCKRTLLHESPHAGAVDDYLKTWPGTGNAVDACNRAHKCFGKGVGLASVEMAARS